MRWHYGIRPLGKTILALVLLIAVLPVAYPRDEPGSPSSAEWDSLVDEFCQGDLVPGLENQLHGFGVASHFLLIPGMEGLDFKVGQQLFDLPVGEFAAFDPGG